MFGKTVGVPKLLKELHGESTTIGKIILVYFSAIIVSGIAVAGTMKYSLPNWKVILVGVIFLDIGGGVVANMSYSTNRFYRSKLTLRFAFLLLHVVQPAIMLLVFPNQFFILLFCYAYTLICSVATVCIRQVDMQRIAAGLFVSIGISILLIIPNDGIDVVYLFGLLYMIKLVLGFSVNRND